MHNEHRSNDNSLISTNPSRVNKIGRLLLQLGKISAEDTERILKTQKEDGLLFGDAAIKLGLISNSDIEQAVAMQFNYHYLQAGQGSFSKDLVTAYEPFSEQSEAYRALRSQLMMRWFKEGNKSLAVVSPENGDGVSYLSANLAVVFSQLGARTLLIDANMRAPMQHTIFNLNRNIGLSDIIAGRSGLDAIHSINTIKDLFILSAGTVPPNPQELLGRTSFSYLMRVVSQKYDVILVDTPAANKSADAQSIVQHAGGALLVSRLNHTNLNDLIDLRNQINITSAEIVGAVVNEF